ncbi:HD-GYP domain-containing protein [Vibrio hippocampi]|uniref:Cyclic di-GMP phosphodiesterase n=1 Tax=Vibrio hippocampi TaxID=654686 RepID=A0ABN8DLC1_9VIBR|nr:HD-GYP domain-containing protein [Vibrio hippocampi]CAH0528922.1 Cyclic di-GMP phosphodiesterase [Vibrio hippocampi]
MPAPKTQKLELSYLMPGMFVSSLEASKESQLKVQGRISSYKDIAELEKRGIRFVWVDKSLSAKECIFPKPALEKRSPAKKQNASVTRTPSAPQSPEEQTGNSDASPHKGMNHPAVLVLETRNIVSKLIDKDIANLEKMAEELNDWSDSIVAAVSADESMLRITMTMREANTYLLEHSISTAFLLVRFGHFLKLDQHTLSQLAIGGLIHDLGKIDLDQEVLNKPSKLSPKEFEHIKQHPQLGFRRANNLSNISRISKEICLLHHEKIDGTGYPLGVKGEHIPLYVRMASIVDVYDALTAERVYKRGMDSIEAFKILTNMAADGTLDRSLVYKFINCVGVYPLGSMVELTNGEVGIVWNSTAIATKPMIKCFFSSKLATTIPVKMVDLSLCDQRIVRSVACADLPISVSEYYKD